MINNLLDKYVVYLGNSEQICFDIKDVLDPDLKLGTSFKIANVAGKRLFCASTNIGRLPFAVNDGIDETPIFLNELDNNRKSIFVGSFQDHDPHIVSYGEMESICDCMGSPENLTSVDMMQQDYVEFNGISVTIDGDPLSINGWVNYSYNRSDRIYFGTTHDAGVIFTNSKDILEYFCDKIYRITGYSSFQYFIKDNELKIYDDRFCFCPPSHFTLDNIINGDGGIAKYICMADDKNFDQTDQFVENSSNDISSEKTSQSIDSDRFADDILKSIKNLFGNINSTKDAINEQILKSVQEAFESADIKKLISSNVINQLDKETQQKVLEIIKKYLNEASFDEIIKSKVEDATNKKVSEYVSKVQVPKIYIIKLDSLVKGQIKDLFFHEKFEQILKQTQLDEPIMLIGPAGSGKNYAVQQVADALGLKMYYTNNASNEFKLTGFIDAGGNYRDTEFYKAFKNGGLFFLDEIDTSDPAALIVLNSALANGYMAFPHETIDRHHDFRIIAAANTFGKGSDLQYVGRNALDAATLDRFDNIFFDYDRNLERALYPNEEVLEFMWQFRDAVNASKIQHVVSTRGIGKVYKKEINGIPLDDILTSNIIKNLSQDDINTIIGNMDVIYNNKFYSGLKRIRLDR